MISLFFSFYTHLINLFSRFKLTWYLFFFVLYSHDISLFTRFILTWYLYFLVLCKNVTLFISFYTHMIFLFFSFYTHMISLFLLVLYSHDISIFSFYTKMLLSLSRFILTWYFSFSRFILTWYLSFFSLFTHMLSLFSRFILIWYLFSCFILKCYSLYPVSCSHDISFFSLFKLLNSKVCWINIEKWVSKKHFPHNIFRRC